MIAQVMQQLFGPVFQGASGDIHRPVGGDQGDEFAGLMAEGDDSPLGAEGEVKAVTDSPLPPMATPELASSTPAVIAVQFSLGAALELPANLQRQDILGAAAVQDKAGESPTAPNPSDLPLLPNAPPVLVAEPQVDLMASAAFAKVGGGEVRGPLRQSVVMIDPSIAGTPSDKGMPDLVELVQKRAAPDAPVRAQTAAKVLNTAEIATFGAEKIAPESTPANAANSGTALDRPSGGVQQPSVSIAPSAAPSIGPQIQHLVVARPVVAGLVDRSDASGPLLAQQPIASTGDSPTPRITLRPVSPAANVALAVLQGIVENADSQTKIDTASAASAVRAGDTFVSHPPTTQLIATVSGQGAVPAAAQTPAHMTAALVASAAGDAADLLGTAQDEDAPNSLFGFEARHGFAPTLGTSAAGTGSPVFAGAPATAAQLSAQLLPLAQSAQSGPVELVLSPAELGQLRFEIQHRGDQVQIVLSAERPETLDLLRRNSEQLLTDFRNAGFAGASLAFGGWGAGQNAGGSPQEFDSDSQSDGGTTAVQVPSSPPSQNAAFARAQSYLDPSRSLNLRL